MKKIVLFSVIMCGLIGVAFGEKFCGVECDSDRDGKFMVCPDDRADIKKCNGISWENISSTYWCSGENEAQPGYINVGRWNRAAGVILWVKKGTAKTGNGYLFDNSNKKNVCSSCRQGFKWNADKEECVNVAENSVTPSCDPNHPENCRQNPRVPQLSKPCGGDKKVNDFCNAGNHATLGRCRNLDATKDGVTQFTCAATECENGYLLWLDKNGKSMGICHTEKYAKNFCSKGCGNCNPNEECVPWIVDTPNNLQINGRNLVPKKNGAYRECHCVVKTDGNGGNGGGGDSSPDTEECKECVYTLKVDLRCANGPTFYKDTQIKITKAEAEKFRWEKAKNKLDTAKSGALIDDLLKEIDGYKELINTICRTGNNAGGMMVDIDNSAEINAAKNKISSFFNTAESNASVWKDAEGKFNTARLASDLTAGVVLGTVGGVVSGVVIKKKQVEKGFEALHCTVGGQTVADWGDTFNVGLR